MIIKIYMYIIFNYSFYYETIQYKDKTSIRKYKIFCRSTGNFYTIMIYNLFFIFIFEHQTQ